MIVPNPINPYFAPRGERREKCLFISIATSPIRKTRRKMTIIVNATIQDVIRHGYKAANQTQPPDIP